MIDTKQRDKLEFQKKSLETKAKLDADEALVQAELEFEIEIEVEIEKNKVLSKKIEELEKENEALRKKLDGPKKELVFDPNLHSIEKRGKKGHSYVIENDKIISGPLSEELKAKYEEMLK